MVRAVKGAGFDVPVDTDDLFIEGSCAACVPGIEAVLAGLPGVIESSVSPEGGSVKVRRLGTLTVREDVIRALASSGYRASEEAGDDNGNVAAERRAEKEYAALRNSVISGAILAVLIMAGSMGRMLGWVPPFLKDPFVLWLLATPVQFILGGRFYRAAWNSLRHGTAEMNTLIAVGTSSAYLYSVAVVLFPGVFRGAGLPTDVYFDTSAAIVVLILFGRMLEARARGKTSEAVRRLLGLRPTTARLIRDGKEVEVRIESVKEGDILVVRPGERVPVDGVITEGGRPLTSP